MDIPLLSSAMEFFASQNTVNDSLQEEQTVMTKPIYNSILLFSNKLYQASIDVVGCSKNLVLSPFCLYQVIGATAVGSRSSTLEQIEQAMSLSISDTTWHGGMRKILKDFVASDVMGTNRIANEIVLKESCEVSSEYLRIINSVFLSTVRKADFEKADEVRREVNERISKLTQGMIKELLPEGSISPMTYLIISTAYCFKKKWLHKFDEIDTIKPFYISDNVSIKVPMMHQIGWFKKASFADLDTKALYLPYEVSMLKLFRDSYHHFPGQDNRHGLLLVLPDETDGLQELEQRLFEGTYEPKDFLEKMHETFVEINMPKFKISFKTEISEILVKMGIVDLFHEKASDLSGISSRLGKETVKIVQCYHESVVEVDEFGTKASSASALICDDMCLAVSDADAIPCELFELTHPFLFYLVDLVNDAMPLFMGRVVDPGETS